MRRRVLRQQLLELFLTIGVIIGGLDDYSRGVLWKSVDDSRKSKMKFEIELMQFSQCIEHKI